MGRAFRTPNLWSPHRLPSQSRTLLRFVRKPASCFSPCCASCQPLVSTICSPSRSGLLGVVVASVIGHTPSCLAFSVMISFQSGAGVADMTHATTTHTNTDLHAGLCQPVRSASGVANRYLTGLGVPGVWLLRCLCPTRKELITAVPTWATTQDPSLCTLHLRLCT